MQNKKITAAVSPIDGRYASKTRGLAPYFSEPALIGYRAYMEVQYLLALSEYGEANNVGIPTIGLEAKQSLREFAESTVFDEAFTNRVKALEKTTNHDVKAVEYAIKEFLTEQGFAPEFISYCHFALTSEDVNNLAYAHMMHDATHEVMLEELDDLRNSIATLAQNHAKTPLLSRTHGQPATPTTFGKEMMIFVKRLDRQMTQLRDYKIRVKLNGSSGNYNGHMAAYPQIQWPQFVQEFIDNSYKDTMEEAYFEVNHWTNQIEDHDTYAELFAIFQRINIILKNFAKDIWLYISNNLIVQHKKDGEIGSSAMPHKINPLDFENAEGNTEVANALFEMFSCKLPDSRLQRDLSDSTVERNIGSAFSYSLIVYGSLIKGLSKISVNEARMIEEVNDHPEILAEAYQLVMKKYGYGDSYESLKDLTRGKPVTLPILHEFIDKFDLPIEEKDKLKALTPAAYVGLAEKLAYGFPVVDLNYKMNRI